MSFHDFLEKFIQRFLITDSVLSSIGAYELMKFLNRIDKLDLSQQQKTPLNILKRYMIAKNIAVIKHADLFNGDLIFNDEQNLAMYWYNNENKKFISH